MKPFAQRLVCAALCLSAVGCGTSQGRIWRGYRSRMTTLMAPETGSSSSNSMYAPPVEPPYEPARMAEPNSVAPPVRSGDFEPMPTPALRFENELPPPPAEDEESVQFTIPVPPSPMPNALNPIESKPILEQSSATGAGRGPAEVLGEGKIALRIEGHSTFTPRTNPARLMPIEPLDAAKPFQGTMQVQYVPHLAPVPAL